MPRGPLRRGICYGERRVVVSEYYAFGSSFRVDNHVLVCYNAHEVKGMKDRIRAIRKHFHMTQPEFGTRIGVSRDVVASFEVGRVAPSEPVVRLICGEFGVDYGWLKSGAGEMFAAPDDGVLPVLAELMEGENETAKAVLRACARLTHAQWAALGGMLQLLNQ